MRVKHTPGLGGWIPVLLLAAVSALVLLPVLWLEGPGYYGDDYHLIHGLQQVGFEGFMKNWFYQYGTGYRPIGIALDISMYILAGERAQVFYIVNTLVFLTVGWAVYASIVKLSGNVAAGLFIAVFFVLFPLSSTAYMQLSSVVMMVAALFVVLLIGAVLRSSDSYGTWSRAVLVGLAWMVIMFIYEQPVGLYALVGVALVTASILKIEGHSFVSVSRLGISVTVCTGLFLAAYLFHPGNPKIVSINTVQASEPSVSQLEVQQEHEVINAPSVVKEASGGVLPLLDEAPVDDVSFGTVVHQEPASVEALSPDVPELVTVPAHSKFYKMFRFLVDNVTYSLARLWDTPALLVVLAAVLVIGIYAVVRVEVKRVSSAHATAYLVAGGAWTILTMAPFFLYGRFAAPPYVFMIPSVGMGMALYGAYRLLVGQLENEKISVYGLKGILLMILVLFPLQQYGYFFALKEELRYSADLGKKVLPYKKDILQGTIVRVWGVPERPHKHVFWIEKAVGYRAFLTVLNDEVVGARLKRHPAGNAVDIFMPDLRTENSGIVDVDLPKT